MSTALPLYTTPLQRLGHWALLIGCGAIFLFLIAPVLVVMPLAFNQDPYFNFPIRNWSLRWFEDLFGNPVWLHAIGNSMVTAVCATLLATTHFSEQVLTNSRYFWRLSKKRKF